LVDFQKIGQPSVIGEIIAGNTYFIRSLFSRIFRSFISCGILGKFEIFESDWVNPFMFVIGMELDLKVLKIKPMKP
jgi:Kef-type K+ transport system membrane component KefB